MRQPKLVLSREAPFLEQIFGDGEGRVFSLENDSVTIGRGDQNDVVLPSNSVSRNHAIIERSASGYTIRDNGSKNGILINGETVREATLREGDVFQVGDFAFRFKTPGAIDQEPKVPALAGGAKWMSQLGSNLKKGKKQNVGPPSRRPLIYGILAVALVFVFMFKEDTPQTSTKSPDTTSDSSSSAPYMENLDPRKAKSPGPRVSGLEDPTKSQAENEMANLDWGNSGLKESEQYFRMGRREYSSKNFQRAIRLFQTSLSFDRQHPLSNFYLQLAVAEVEMEAKKHAETGLKYFESLQFDRAIYHFKQSISYMAHRPTSDMVVRAREYIKISTERMRAAELFP